MRTLLALALIGCLAACGGGAGGGDDPADPGGATGGGGAGGSAGGGGGPTPNPGPQIALLMVNGHSFNTVPNYLATAAGPFLEAALQGAGYSVETSYFTDDAGGGTPGGQAELVAKLQQVQDDWITNRTGPTRIVIVPHSHGGVRAHAALRAKPLVAVRLLADLDTSSNGWATVHPAETLLLGGAVVDAHTIAGAIACTPLSALLPDETGPLFDVEDVVFDNVQEAFEVRTGDVVPNPLQPEYYDERWNTRPDGSRRGLTCHASYTTHTEPTLPVGLTLPAVRDWVLARLASDP